MSARPPNLVVVVLGTGGVHKHHAVHIEDFDARHASATVLIGKRRYALQSPTRLGELRMVGTCNGRPFTAQVERGGVKNPLAIRVGHNGLQIETLALLPRAAELLQLMPHKPPPDLSRFLLSPMPGLLADIRRYTRQAIWGSRMDR